MPFLWENNYVFLYLLFSLKTTGIVLSTSVFKGETDNSNQHMYFPIATYGYGGNLPYTFNATSKVATGFAKQCTLYLNINCCNVKVCACLILHLLKYPFSQSSCFYIDVYVFAYIQIDMMRVYVDIRYKCTIRLYL